MTETIERRGLALRQAHAVGTGLVLGLVGTVMAVSYGAVIFSGAAGSLLAVGLSISLLSGTLFATWAALFNARSGLVPMLSGPTAVVTATLSGAVAVDLLAPSQQGTLLATVLAALGVSTFLVGASFYVLGRYRLGDLVRFIPYPVIGGYSAGIGGALILAGVQIVTGFKPTFDSWPMLSSGPAPLKILAGAGAALAFWSAARAVKGGMSLPLAVGGTIAAFYAITSAAGLPLSEVQAAGWTLGPYPDLSVAQGSALGWLALVDWRVVTQQLPHMGAVVLICMTTFLLYLSSLEIAIQKDLDLDQQLRSTGLANLVFTPVGGLPTYCNLSSSLLAHRMGGTNRIVLITMMVVVGAVFVVGVPALAYLPRPVIGGLVMFNGAALLWQWTVPIWARLPKTDCAIILLILATTLIAGFLEGVLVGVVAGVALFVVEYSRVSGVRHVLTGRELQSPVDRPYASRQHLNEQGGRIVIVGVDGYLFFGTANSLLRRTIILLRQPNSRRRFLILDCRLLRNVDSSAVFSLIRLRQFAESNHVTLVFTQVNPNLWARLNRNGFGVAPTEPVRSFGDLQRGLEWAENELLAGDQLALQSDGALPIAAQMERFVGKPAAAALLRLMYRIQLEAGQILIPQGHVSDDMFFVESGVVSVQLELAGGQTVQVRTLGPGALVGEVAFYLRAPRTASVVASIPAVVYRLTRETLAELTRTAPSVAAAVHLNLAELISRRLAETNRLLSRVMD